MTDDLGDSDSVIRDLLAGDLIEFVKWFWSALHPGQEFVDGTLVRTIARHLEAVDRAEITRLMINVPPGSCKSMLVSVYFPLWRLLQPNGASKSAMGVSYSASISRRDLDFTSRIIASDLWQRLFPELTIRDGQDRQDFFELKSGASRAATSVGGTITGRRVQLLIIDDPVGAQDAESELEMEKANRVVGEVLPSRLTVTHKDAPESAIILILQRLSGKDPAATIIMDDGPDGLAYQYTQLILPMTMETETRCWTKVVSPSPRGAQWMRRVRNHADQIPHYVPATPHSDGAQLLYCQDDREEGDLLIPERFDQAAVDKLTAAFMSTGGASQVSSQLQQRPTSRDGGLFQSKDFPTISQADFARLEADGQVLSRCRGWDFAASTASTADYTASVRMAMLRDGTVIIEHCTEERIGPGDVTKAVVRFAHEDPVGTIQSAPQDPGASGLAVKKHLSKALHGTLFHFSLESGSKRVRAGALAAQAECGNVRVLKSRQWNDTFLGRMLTFPGRFDDVVDAASRAYSALLVPTEDDLASGGCRIIECDADDADDRHEMPKYDDSPYSRLPSAKRIEGWPDMSGF